jgi:hypothetical protein
MNYPEHYSVVTFSPSVTLDQIPEAPTCGYCGAPTTKAFLEYSCLGSKTIIVNPQAAGYECTNQTDECSAHYYSDEAAIETLTQAIELLTDPEDEYFKDIFRKKILMIIDKQEVIL